MLKSHELTSNRKIIQIVIVMAIIGFGLLIYDYINTQVNFENTLHRNEAGFGKNKEILDVFFEDSKEELTIDVSEKQLSKKEIEDIFAIAKEEIDKTYLGKNTKSEKVMYDLDIKESYADGLVTAKWEFDNYQVIGMDGALNQNNISPGGDIVSARIFLKYSDFEEIYNLNFIVCPLSMDTYEGKINAIKSALEEKDKATISKSEMILPDKVGEMPIEWKRKMNFRGLQIIILGFVASVLVYLGAEEENRKQRIVREKALGRDYPMIVSELSILMGAGMSFRVAIERISKKYINKVKEGAQKSPGYEEIVKTYRQISDGIGEIQAINNLSKRIEDKNYRRLCMLLEQNLKRGSRDLLLSLEKEEQNSFEMRKQLAMKAGEEASTKMLIPMSGMLLIVIAILVVPALMQMNY